MDNIKISFECELVGTSEQIMLFYVQILPGALMHGKVINGHKMDVLVLKRFVCRLRKCLLENGFPEEELIKLEVQVLGEFDVEKAKSSIESYFAE
jgi:hypothetical protein